MYLYSFNRNQNLLQFLHNKLTSVTHSQTLIDILWLIQTAWVLWVFFLRQHRSRWTSAHFLYNYLHSQIWWPKYVIFTLKWNLTDVEFSSIELEIKLMRLLCFPVEIKETPSISKQRANSHRFKWSETTSQEVWKYFFLCE